MHVFLHLRKIQKRFVEEMQPYSHVSDSGQINLKEILVTRGSCKENKLIKFFGLIFYFVSKLNSGKIKLVESRLILTREGITT